MVVLANIDHRASATAFDVMDLRGTALGHLVAKQTLVNKYSHPPRPLGRGPTKSMAMLSNGSVMTGQATIGAFLGAYLSVLAGGATLAVGVHILFHIRPSEPSPYHGPHLFPS